MFKVRALLCLVMALLVAVAGVLWLQSSDLGMKGWSGLREILLGVDALLMLSAVATLALTTIHLTRTADGRLVFGGGSGRLWNFWLKEFHDKETSVSLCRTYWEIVFGLVLAVAVVGTACGLVYLVGGFGYDVVRGNVHPQLNLNDPGQVNGLILGSLLVGALIFLVWDKSRNPHTMGPLGLIGLVSLASFLVFAEVMSTWAFLDKGYSLPLALVMGPGIILGILAGYGLIGLTAVGIILGVFKCWKALRDTAFGRMLLAAKNNACPVFELPPPPPSPEPDPANPPAEPQTT